MPAAAAPIPLPVIVPATLDVPAVPDILEEHLEELGYLCLKRRKLIFSTEIPLRRLPELDERIAAHWDGLVLGGRAAVDVALTRLEDDNPWIAATAARVWLALGRPDLAALVEKLSEVPEPAWATWREAFRRAPVPWLLALVSTENIAKQPMPLRMLLVDAYAWNGKLPPGVAVMEVRQGPPAVRAAAARHMCSLPKDPMWAVLAGELVTDKVLAVGRCALWSLGLLDRLQAVRALRAHMAGPPADLDPARLLMCGIFGEREDAARLLALKGEAPAVAAATRAVGELGGAECVGPLLERLAVAELDVALAAAAALERILGPLASLVPSPEAEAAEVPPPPNTALVALEVNERKSKLPNAACHLDNRGFPWTGAPSEEPMAWLWRASVRGNRTDVPWMRQEIPDGVLVGEWALDARVGE